MSDDVAARRERQVAEWERRLATEGRVEFRASRRRQGLALAFALLITGVSAALVATWELENVFWGGLAGLFGLWLVVAIGWSMARHRPLFVVDPQGFSVRAKKRDQWRPWVQVVDARPQMVSLLHESISIASITDAGRYDHTRLAPMLAADQAALVLWIGVLARRAQAALA